MNTIEPGSYCPQCYSFDCIHLKPAKFCRLTPREVDMVRNVAAGKTDKEIANALNLSHATVKQYLFRLYAKLFGTNTGNPRGKLMLWAYEHPAVMRPAIEQPAAPFRETLTGLTDKERQILELLSSPCRFSRPEIADQLLLHVDVLERRIERIRWKTGFKESELIAWWTRITRANQKRWTPRERRAVEESSQPA